MFNQCCIHLERLKSKKCKQRNRAEAPKIQRPCNFRIGLSKDANDADARSFGSRGNLNFPGPCHRFASLRNPTWGPQATVAASSISIGRRIDLQDVVCIQATCQVFFHCKSIGDPIFEMPTWLALSEPD